MTHHEPQPYEYKVLEVGSEAPLGLSKTSELPEKRLNEFGVEGWEMVGQINMENGATQALIFKRPIEKERTEERKQELKQEDSSGGLFGKMKDMVEEEAERQQNDR